MYFIFFSFFAGFAALFSYIFFKPLPENITDRRILQLFEPIFRFLYFYPVKLMNFFHFYTLHVRYSRLFFRFISWLPSKISALCKKCRVYNELFDSIDVKVYVPDNLKRHQGAIFYIHGGGYVLFDADSFDSITRRLCLECGVVVVSVNYRRAPEHEFLTSLEDCQKALKFFLREAENKYNVDSTNVLVMGDSAGGAMATVLARKFKSLKAQILVYPWTQAVDFLTPSFKYANQFTKGTSLLDTEMMAIWTLMYTNHDIKLWPKLSSNCHHNLAYCQKLLINHNYPKNAAKNDEIYNFSDDLIRKLFHPDFSPLFSPQNSLTGCPETLIFTCEYDVLKDDGILYKNRLEKEGVKVQHVHFDRGFHGMLNFCNQLNLSNEMMNKAVNFAELMFSKV
uniref:Alpha/beta hydrolase fold-3 domain-containing protein n=1 Tax=Romanomermis culicivorax TaxID=13658 RepID=A0A915LA41_ROMCU